MTELENTAFTFAISVLLWPLSLLWFIVTLEDFRDGKLKWWQLLITFGTVIAAGYSIFVTSQQVVLMIGNK